MTTTTHSSPRRLAATGALILGLTALGTLALLLLDRPPTKPATVPETSGPSVVARVGDTPITAEELLAGWRKRRSAADPRESQANVLEDLVRRELLFAEASRTGFTERDDLRAAWRSLVVSRFQEERQALYARAVAVTEDDITAYYRGHAEEFTTPERRHLAVLRIPCPPHASPERRAQLGGEAEALRERVLAAPPAAGDFGDFARGRSSPPLARAQGGDVGSVTLAQARRAWPGEVAETAFSLGAAGEVSPVVATQEGWYLARLVERQPGRTLSLDSVRERIRRDLERRREAEAEARYLAELRHRHPVQILTNHLEALAPQEAALVQQPPRLPAP